LYVTGLEAEKSMEARNKQVNFNYIMLNHNSVADSQVVVTEKELRDYYDKNKKTTGRKKFGLLNTLLFL
jgi:peptidyl-prolyl cis-trans isomerase D